MRGGNRQRPLSTPDGGRPTPVPRGLEPLEAAIWRELGQAVADLGTYRPSDRLSFALMVKIVHQAMTCPPDAKPTAAARLATAANSALASFGLTPLSRQRVKGLTPEQADAQRAEAIRRRYGNAT